MTHMISDQDFVRLQLAKAEDIQMTEVFRLKTQCNQCGYQSMDIYPEQNTVCPLDGCYGDMEDFNGVKR